MAIFRATGSAMNLADGIYPSTLLAIDEQAPVPGGPSADPWLKWRFLVYDGSEDGCELTAASSCRSGPKSKARGWVEAVLGRRLAVGEELDTERICPAPCQVLLKKDVSSGFMRIEDVLGAPRPVAPPLALVPDNDDIPF